MVEIFLEAGVMSALAAVGLFGGGCDVYVT